jgi:hypothetical protein
MTCFYFLETIVEQLREPKTPLFAKGVQSGHLGEEADPKRLRAAALEQSPLTNSSVVFMVG